MYIVPHCRLYEELTFIYNSDKPRRLDSTRDYTLDLNIAGNIHFLFYCCLICYRLLR